MAKAALDAPRRVERDVWVALADASHPWWALPCTSALVLRLVNGPLTVDDAYITFRYARNIVDGLGFVYNAGEPVLGTTTPFWALLLAAVHAMSRAPLPDIALVLNATFDAASSVVLYALVRRLGGGPPAGALAAFLFAAAPMGVAYAAGGMEASLFVLLLGLAGLCSSAGRPGGSLAFAALATLTRPEGLLAAGLLLVHRVWGTRRPPVREAGIYLGLLLPWVAYATGTFGGPLPQTVAAKSAAYQVHPLANAVALALQPGLPGLSLFGLASLPLAPLVLAAAALVASACLASFGLRLALRVAVRAPLAFFPLLYAAAYAAAGLRGVRMFHWYVVPLIPFYCVALGLAAERLSRASSIYGARLLPYAALIVWWLPAYAFFGPHPIYPLGFSLEREQVYRQVAEEYASDWGPQTVLAAPEIGTLGYYSRARILDTVGLVSPVAARYPPLPREMLASDNAIAPALIRAERPEYVVSLDQFLRQSLLPDPWFREAYELIERRPARIWASEELLVFRRLGGVGADG
jgi:hypothetical protein